MNLERGRELFERKLLRAQLVNAQHVELLTMLRKSFRDQVGVMGINGAFAASRLADACIEAVQSDETESDLVVAMALQKYLEKSPERMQTKRSENPGELKKVREASEEEVMADPNYQDKLLLHEEFASMQPYKDPVDGVAANNCDFVDVMDDIPKEYLTVEGKRSRGFIAANFDTTQDEAPEETDDNRMRIKVPAHGRYELGEMVMAKQYVLQCPRCFSRRMHVDGENWMDCMDCEARFIIDYDKDEEFNLSLTVEDQAAPIILLPPGVTR